MNKIITIVNPRGATYGYNGPYVPITTVVLFDGRSFHGYQNLPAMFGGMQPLSDFLLSCVTAPVGTSCAHSMGTYEITWTVMHERVGL